MSDVALVVESLEKRYNRQQIFNNINLQMKSGESCAIVGSNGSGKTSLLKILAGIDRDHKGAFEYSNAGEAVKHSEVKNMISYSSPILQLYQELSALEHLQFFCNIDVVPKDYKDLLLLDGKMDFSHKKISELSTGMQQRVKIMLAFALDRKVWLFDEITLGLDVVGKKLIYDLLDRKKHDKIMLFATNDPVELNCCDRIVSLD